MSVNSRPWRNKDFLEDLYVKQRKTISEIAEICELRFGIKVTPMTIYNNLKDFGLLRKNRQLGPRRFGGTGKKKGFYY
jgi:hypothetical protein